MVLIGLRMIGFACSVMTVKTPMAAVIQYGMLFTGIAAGVWIIVAGVVIEPPAALLEAVNKSNARIARLCTHEAHLSQFANWVVDRVIGPESEAKAAE